MRKWLVLASLVFSSVSAWGLTPVSGSQANKYMVENTTGTNNCYEFQTWPTCFAQIQNLSVTLSSSAIPGGSTQYIQNTGTPSTATQIFNVSSGTATNLVFSTATSNVIGPVTNSCGYIIGSMVQISSTASVNSSSTTTSTFVTVKSIKVSITPKCSTDKILISVSGPLTVGAIGVNAWLTVKRNGTDLANGADGFCMTRYSASAGTVDYAGCAFEVTDNPASLSALTYQAYIKNNDGGTKVSFPADTDDVTGIITAKEIAQ